MRTFIVSVLLSALLVFCIGHAFFAVAGVGIVVNDGDQEGWILSATALVHLALFAVCFIAIFALEVKLAYTPKERIIRVRIPFLNRA